jgi:uncharacterized protein
MAASFKVLAVDGGGIRGIIPALLLAAIEDQTKRRICESFDLIAGTSTGGIIALGLAKPDPEGHVEKSATDIVRLYEEEGDVIFPPSIMHRLHVGAVRGAKYNPHGIDLTLQKYFGQTRLKDALKPVLVPSYDIEKQTPIFFKSWRARTDPSYDFFMRDVARATSAAPTYFPPARISTSDPLDYYALIDGGVVAGNPALCAYAEAVRMVRESDADPAGIVVVSLGTGELRNPLRYDRAYNLGQLGWAQPIIDIVLQGSNDTVDYQLQQLLQTGGAMRAYFRFQLDLSRGTGEMDDASTIHLKQLIDLTQDYLGQPDTRDNLSQICDLLVR